jgi:hypothetical protein
VSTEPTAAPETPRASAPAPRLGIALAIGIALLATLETAQALIAPTRAPTPSDWGAVATAVRAGFRPGDLIVAAPAWADPVLRQYLGDVITIPMAARMDDARYGRVWEVGQHGAHAAEARGTATEERRFGALTVRLVERPPAQITYDFLEHWTEARVTRWEPGARRLEACPWRGDRFACPTGGAVHRELVEVDTRIRRALMAPPVANAIMAVEFPAVPLGRQLELRAGLHDVWARKLGRGTVNVEVWIDGQPITSATVGNRSGWLPIRIDTTLRDGQTASVRVQISSPEPNLRQLAFAAEARR